jgi:uncharacterized membrane protein
MLNPFDLRSALLARHAQHVVLIHFPIALYVGGTVADVCARVFRKSGLVDAARWNFLAAALLGIPAAASGVLAWRWALEGQHLKGILRLHLWLGCALVLAMWLTFWLRSKGGSCPGKPSPLWLLSAEVCVSLMIAITSHLGGFLSGVNSGSAPSTVPTPLIIRDLRGPCATVIGLCRYYDPRTLFSGSLGPLVNSAVLLKVAQRVGGRAGTAVPQGTVCELPNPLLDFSLSPLKAHSRRLKPCGPPIASDTVRANRECSKSDT